MKKYIVLFNPFAGNSKCADNVKKISTLLTDAEISYVDMTSINSYAEFFATVDDDTEIVLAGGDGTLNRFLNDIDGLDFNRNLYLYSAGSGNDFVRDIGGDPEAVIDVTKYVKNLPVAEVKGKKYRFFNDLGFGIDGYCCEEGDKVRAKKPGSDVNYTSIAIKGLLFGFKRSNATVIVDGVKKEYKHVWLAPSMNGRYYGGGMMAAPTQDRLNEEQTVSVVVMHHWSKLKTLIVFPSIFKGEHIKHTEMIDIIKGHDVDVTFDRPCAVQVDGETITGVTHYHVKADPATRAAKSKDN